MLHSKVEAFSAFAFNSGHTFYVRLVVYSAIYVFIVYRMYSVRGIQYISDYFAASTISLVLLFQNIQLFICHFISTSVQI